MPPYLDTDFLYFDTDTRTVIGRVEWTKSGDVKPLQKPERPQEGTERRRRGRPRKEYYIWGTYRSLKRLYNLEGKSPQQERTQTLDEAMARSLQEVYWD